MFAEVTGEGKLKKAFLPAIYLDSSVFIDYWLTEGYNFRPEDPVLDHLDRVNEPPHYKLIREVVNNKSWFKRLEVVREIREKLMSQSSKFTLIVTPVTLMEFSKWYAENGFRNILSDVAGASFLKRKSDKELGELLKRTLDASKAEDVQHRAQGKSGASALGFLVSETWPNWSFGISHTMKGLYVADVQNFSLSFERIQAEISAYNFLQLDGIDVVHILLGQHLGCSHIASFDSDFERVKDSIKEDFGIEALTSAEELLNIL